VGQGRFGRRPTFFVFKIISVIKKKVGRRPQSLAGPTLQIRGDSQAIAIFIGTSETNSAEPTVIRRGSPSSGVDFRGAFFECAQTGTANTCPS
jgi:hypothetical protein